MSEVAAEFEAQAAGLEGVEDVLIARVAAARTEGDRLRALAEVAAAEAVRLRAEAAAQDAEVERLEDVLGHLDHVVAALRAAKVLADGVPGAGGGG